MLAGTRILKPESAEEAQGDFAESVRNVVESGRAFALQDSPCNLGPRASITDDFGNTYVPTPCLTLDEKVAAAGAWAGGAGRFEIGNAVVAQ